MSPHDKNHPMMVVWHEDYSPRGRTLGRQLDTGVLHANEVRRYRQLMEQTSLSPTDREEMAILWDARYPIAGDPK